MEFRLYGLWGRVEYYQNDNPGREIIRVRTSLLARRAFARFDVFARDTRGITRVLFRSVRYDLSYDSTRTMQYIKKQMRACRVALCERWR